MHTCVSVFIWVLIHIQIHDTEVRSISPYGDYTHAHPHTNALFPSAVVLLCVYFQVSFETKLKDNYKLELVNVLHEHALLMTATR